MTDEAKAISGVAIIAFIVYLYWMYQSREYKKRKYYADNYYKNVCNSLMKIEGSVVALHQIEWMIDDLEHFAEYKKIDINMPSTLDGSLFDTNITIYDQETADKYIDLLAPERDRRRSLLLEDLEEIVRTGLTVTDYNKVENKFKMSRGEPSKVVYIDHKTGIHYNDRSMTNPDSDFDMSKYTKLSTSQRKAYASRMYQQLHDEGGDTV